MDELRGGGKARFNSHSWLSVCPYMHNLMIVASPQLPVVDLHAKISPPQVDLSAKNLGEEGCAYVVEALAFNDR